MKHTIMFNSQSQNQCSFTKFTLVIFLMFICLFNTSNTQITKKKILKVSDFKMNSKDPVSYSHSTEVVQKRINFKLTIDMEKEYLDGYNKIYYKCLNKNKSDTIILDVNSLILKKIVDNKDNILKYKIIHKEAKSKTIGNGLVITLNKDTKCKADSYVKIYYRTAPKNALGLHFSSNKIMTDKRYKFMYTHGEAIFGRSFFPSQDTPSLKILSKATLIIKKPYTAMFSGRFISKEDLTIGNEKYTKYKYDLKIPIPTYLVTFSAGVIDRIEITPRCYVYGEKVFVKEKASLIKKSFKNCEDYIKFYEKLHPFVFEKMKFLLVPNDLAYSGMENPYVTFIGQYMLSKDRSYSGTVAHEIAHFWSGNLVTNESWKDFWLNEGITTYLTRKALKHVDSKKRFELEMYKGQNRLRIAIKKFKRNDKFKKNPSLRSLQPEIINKDPYFAFSSIPYEKGCFLLYHIEKIISEKNINKILKNYFNKFKYKNINTALFVNFFNKNIKKIFGDKKGKQLIKKINWKPWLTGTGTNPIFFKFNTFKIRRMKRFLRYFKWRRLNLRKVLNKFSQFRRKTRTRILIKLRRISSYLTPRGIVILRRFLTHKGLFNQKLVNAQRKLLLIYLEDNKKKKINMFKKLLSKYNLYKTTFIKKIFIIMKNRLGMSKDFLRKLFKKYEKMYNPITVIRVKEAINS